MSRIIFRCGLSCLLMLSTALCFAAEQAAVSVIFSSDTEAYKESWEGFRKFLNEENVPLKISKYSLMEKKPEAVCSRIEEESPDIILTLGTKASKLAKERIRNIPIVFSVVLNPRTVTGSNITGVSMNISPGVKLENAWRIIPNMKRVGFIHSPDLDSLSGEISKACAMLGIEVVKMRITSEKELPGAVKKIFRQIDCFLMVPDSRIYSPKSVEYLLLESLRQNFPVIGLSSFYTKAGALISFECDYEDLGVQAGEIALRILNGEKPASIQPPTPRKTMFSLNLLTAKRLRLEISDEVVREASEVFGK